MLNIGVECCTNIRYTCVKPTSMVAQSKEWTQNELLAQALILSKSILIHFMLINTLRRSVRSRHGRDHHDTRTDISKSVQTQQLCTRQSQSSSAPMSTDRMPKKGQRKKGSEERSQTGNVKYVQTSKPKGQGNSATSTTEENIQDSGHHWTTCMREGQQTKTKLHTRPNHAP